MNKKNNQDPGTGSPRITDKNNGQAGLEVLLPRPSRTISATEKDELIQKVRRIIAATPEIRAVKVDPLKAAVEQGTYEIDARKLANILIARLILYP